MTKAVPRGQHSLAEPTTRPEASVTIHGKSHEYFVYHGTPKSKLLSILSKGLIGLVDDKRHETSEDGYIYATETEYQAARFAAVDETPGFGGGINGETPGGGVVLKIALTEEEYAKFQPDPKWGNLDDMLLDMIFGSKNPDVDADNKQKAVASMCKCKVTPSHIVGVADAIITGSLDDERVDVSKIFKAGPYVTPRAYVTRMKRLAGVEVTQ